MQISRNDSNAFLPGTIKRRLLHKNKYLFFFKKKSYNRLLSSISIYTLFTFKVKVIFYREIAW